MSRSWFTTRIVQIDDSNREVATPTNAISVYRLTRIQACLAHLLRRSKELREAPPTAACAAWFEKISAVLHDALALPKRRNKTAISDHGLRIAKGKIEAKLDRLLGEPDLHDESLRRTPGCAVPPCHNAFDGVWYVVEDKDTDGRLHVCQPKRIGRSSHG